MEKKFSEVDLAYLAGFLDADGAIMAIIEKHKEKKLRYRVRLNLKITQKHEKIIYWFRSHYNLGYTRLNRTTYDWEIKDQFIIKGLLLALLPYLKVKIEQARIALKILSINESSIEQLIQKAKLADSLSSLNVRSPNRRKNTSTMIQDHFFPND